MSTALNMQSASGLNITLLTSAPTRVRGWSMNNTHATNWVCVRLYDLARKPIPGVDIPVVKILIPPAAANQIPTNAAEFSAGLPFQNGLAYSMTGGASAAATVSPDTYTSTTPGAGDLQGTLEYKLRP